MNSGSLDKNQYFNFSQDKEVLQKMDELENENNKLKKDKQFLVEEKEEILKKYQDALDVIKQKESEMAKIKIQHEQDLALLGVQDNDVQSALVVKNQAIEEIKKINLEMQKKYELQISDMKNEMKQL